MWIAVVRAGSAAEATYARQITLLASSILLKHGFEPGLSCTLLIERALVCVISLTYDREIAGEDERAATCYQNLAKALTARGYVPYRLGIQSMELMRLNAPAASLIQAIKDCVDSAHILSPKRYEPSTKAQRASK